MERELVGRFLIDNDALIQSRVRDKHFTDALAREVYRTISACIADGEEANLLTVTSRSQALGQRAADVSAMTTNAVVGPIAYAEKQVIDGWKKKRLREMAEELRDVTPEAAVDIVDSVLADITATDETDTIREAKGLVKEYIGVLEDRYHGRVDPGVMTGFPALDELIGGLFATRYYIVGARPSDGKSALLLNMANAAGVKQHVPVGIISAESSNGEIMNRTFADLGGVDSRRLATGYLTAADFGSITETAQKISGAPVYYYDVPNVQLSRLVAVARAMKRRYGIKVLYVDYIQLIETDKRFDRRTEEVAYVSRRLKQLARELQIAVVAAAQLTRDAEGRRPGLKDFAESSQLEKDADVAILLQHEEGGRVWAHCEKVRDGAKGSVPLQFIGRFVRFAEEAYSD